MIAFNFFKHRIALVAMLLMFSLLLNAQLPIAHYPMNNSAIDVSKYKNHGKMIGGVTPVADRFGNPCSALLFNGKNGYLEVPSSSILETPRNRISFTVWYKITDRNAQNNWLTVLCKGSTIDEYNYNPQYRFQIQQNTRKQYSTCNPNVERGSSTISLSTEFTKCDYSFENHLFEPGKWHFYALTYDGNEVKAYMDAIQVFSYPYDQELEYNRDPIHIGMDIPGDIEYFDGALDDLKIYDYCISESSIRSAFYESAPLSKEEEFSVDFPKNIDVFTLDDNCIAPVNFPTPQIKSYCGKINITQVEGLPSGSDFPVGNNKITFEASSSSGYVQDISFYVNVKDRIKPILSLQNDTTIYVNNGETGINVNYKDPVATDNCSVKEIKLISGRSTGDFFPLGNTKIIFCAKDFSNNTTFGSFEIKVVELPKKTVTPPDPVKDTIPDVQPDPPVITKNDPVPDTVINPIVVKTGGDINKEPVKEIYSDTLSENYKPNNIIFLIDASSSMSESNKMNYLKYSMNKLVKIFRSIDYMTIIVYAEKVNIKLPPTSIINKDSIIELINSIKTGGGTEGGQALEFSYETIKKNYLENANNEIYLASDMEFDVEKKQEKLIKNSALDNNKPVALNVMAFGGKAALTDDLKKLSNLGKGAYLPINSEADADMLINQIKFKSIK